MRIGLDFDNTIACYDQAIAALADELFELPEGVPRTKLGLRNFLRAADREPEWTAFQGELYGPGMRWAEPFPGAITTMQELIAEDYELFIVSHRSRRPYAGRQHDLHAAARDWVADHLQSAGLFGSVGDISSVRFLETLEEKVRTIAQLGCRAFLDDLPQVFAASGFPPKTAAIWFDPAGASKGLESGNASPISTWSQLPAQLSAL